MSLIGESFKLFRHVNRLSMNGGIRIMSESIGNNTFTVLKNANGGIIAQRMKTIERTAAGVSIRKALTKVNDEEALYYGRNALYNDSVSIHKKIPCIKQEEITWFSGKKPLELNPENLSHDMDLVKTGHVTKNNGVSVSGVPNGFEYLV